MKRCFKSYNDLNLIKDYTIDKYQKLYPEATVESKKGYDRHSYKNSYTLIVVKFKSGSYIDFRLGMDVDSEWVNKKHDEAQRNMETIEVLEMFNNQKAK